MEQLRINFEAGLTEQFPEFKDVLRAAVYSCGRPFKHIAADLDYTSSKLSRVLADNPNDPIHFPADLIPALIESTGDKRPIYWLCEKFLEDPAKKRERAVESLGTLLPQIHMLLKTAGFSDESV